MRLTDQQVREIVETEFNTPDALDDFDTILENAVKAALKVRDQCEAGE